LNNIIDIVKYFSTKRSNEFFLENKLYEIRVLYYRVDIYSEFVYNLHILQKTETSFRNTIFHSYALNEFDTKSIHFYLNIYFKKDLRKIKLKTKLFF
jgi:hypothetical protein